MRVLLDTSYALRGASGTAVYVERLRDALSEDAAALDVELVPVADTRRPPPGGGRASSARNLLRDRWWVDVALPRLAAEHGVDLVHHPLPALSRRLALPQVVTVHDLAFELLPECFDPWFARWASRSHRRAARGADAVIAVSQTTARDVRERWDVPVDRIVVAPHGPGQWRARDIRAGRTERAPSVPVERPYLLYVGDDEPRKDLPTLRRAHAQLLARLGDAAPDLVLAGQLPPQPDSGPAAGPRERVVVGPDRDALLALIDGALALVHPALHEGVGLTPLEAMARGVPVVVARSPGLTETCGDAAAYFPPRDAGALAELLVGLVGDPRRRETMVVAGRRVAGDRSWTIAARRHAEAYRLALGRSHRRPEPEEDHR